MELGLKSVFTGALTLDPSGKPSDRGVVGTFNDTDGKGYQLKTASDAVFEKLAPFDGKLVTVTGKVRVNGKYLIVQSIVPAANSAAAPREKRKRNGL